MIKDGRNGSIPLGTSFLRRMRELSVIIRENISMHNICFQVNIEKPPLHYSACKSTYKIASVSTHKIKKMIEEGRNGSFPSGISFLRRMQEIFVTIKENIREPISMHSISFQVNIEKSPLHCIAYIVTKLIRKEKTFLGIFRMIKKF